MYDYNNDYTHYPADYTDPYHYGLHPQAEFDRQAHGLGKAFRYLAKIFIYLPLLTIGYLVSAAKLTAKDSAFAWLGTTLLVALVVYWLLLFLRRKLIEWKGMGNPVWMPVFVLCLALTCLMTPWVAYTPITHAFAHWGWPHWAAQLADLGIGGIIYYKYDFLGTFR